MKKISIIIPVYNVEKYVEKCLRSCAEQDLPPEEYEIIVVNDGTKDNSLEIVERVAKDYTNITIISQENAGLSAARNKGLSIAKGDYIWFVDSDDWIKENCLKQITETFFNDDLDAITIFGIRFIDGSYFKILKSNPFDSSIMSGKELMHLTLINCAAVKTLYKRNFLLDNNLTFYEGIFHEDHEFTPRAYYYLEKIKVTSFEVYYNRLVKGSITNSINPKKGFDLINVALSLYEFKNNVVKKEDKKVYHYFIAAAINQALYNATNMDITNKTNFTNILYNNRFLFQSFWKSNSLKYKIGGILFTIFPKNSINIYNMFHK